MRRSRESENVSFFKTLIHVKSESSSYRYLEKKIQAELHVKVSRLKPAEILCIWWRECEMYHMYKLQTDSFALQHLLLTFILPTKSVRANFSSHYYALSQTNPRFCSSPQSGELTLRMEYKWHHYVIFNLLLQQYPFPPIALFTGLPISSWLVGLLFFYFFTENIKELLN